MYILNAYRVMEGGRKGETEKQRGKDAGRRIRHNQWFCQFQVIRQGLYFALFHMYIHTHIYTHTYTQINIKISQTPYTAAIAL